MLCKSRADVFKPGDHASTYGGNPLASAAGNAVLDAFEKRNVIDNVWPPAAPARPHPRPHGPRHTAPCRVPPATCHPSRPAWRASLVSRRLAVRRSRHPRRSRRR